MRTTMPSSCKPLSAQAKPQAPEHAQTGRLTAEGANRGCTGSSLHFGLELCSPLCLHMGGSNEVRGAKASGACAVS